MHVVNCTNHEIMIELPDSLIAIPPSGNVARVHLRQVPTMPFDGIPIFRAIPSKSVKGMPTIAEDNLYVVSSTVAQTLRLPNVVCTNHAPAQCTRDHHGRIVSVKSFIRYD